MSTQRLEPCLLCSFDANSLASRTQRRDTTMLPYTGSLTTPPCGEPVQWFVLADTAPVDPGAVLAYEEMLEASGVPFGHNARPVQPLGARMLQYYGFPAAEEREQPRQGSGTAQCWSLPQGLSDIIS